MMRFVLIDFVLIYASVQALLSVPFSCVFYLSLKIKIFKSCACHFQMFHCRALRVVFLHSGSIEFSYQKEA